MQKKQAQMGSGDRFKICVKNGDTFAGKGELGKAIAQYLEALNIDETAKDVHEKLLKIYLNKGDKKGYTDALARFNAVKAGRQILMQPSGPKEQEVEEQEPVQDIAQKEIKVGNRIGYAIAEEAAEETAEEAVEEVAEEAVEEVVEEAVEEVAEEAVEETAEEAVEETAEEAAEETAEEAAEETAEEAAEETAEEAAEETAEEATEEEQKPVMQEIVVPDYKESSRENVKNNSGDLLISSIVNYQQVTQTDENVAQREGNFIFSGNINEDANSLEEALVRDPDNIEILTSLGELYSKGARLKDATIVAIYRKVYRMRI